MILGNPSPPEGNNTQKKRIDPTTSKRLPLTPKVKRTKATIIKVPSFQKGPTVGPEQGITLC
jgi:hypothetical protein